MGVTGARSRPSSRRPSWSPRLRALAPDTLVGVGLGVSNGAQAAEVGRVRGRRDRRLGPGQDALIAAEDAGTPDDLAALRAVVADLAAGVRA